MDIDEAVLFPLAIVVPWAMVVAAVDIRCRRIPVRLQLAGLAIAGLTVGFASLAHPSGSGVALLAAGGAITLTALYFVLRVIAPHHLGGGDLRIAPAVGALGGVGGVDGIVLVCIGPFAVTATIGLLLLAANGSRDVPHGPAMVSCAVLATVHGG